MTKEIIKIKLTDEYKESAMKLIDDTIDKVADKYDFALTPKEKMKIKNLSLDQINVNISHKAKTKSLWVFDAETSLPVIVERDDDLPSLNSLEKSDCGSYQMKTNLDWTFSRANDNEEGVCQEEFEQVVLKMFLEDFETASFYGALSYVTESDRDE